jgi:uncharacterized protein
LIIDANIYWFPEEIFEEEELLQRFLSEIPRGYDTAAVVKTENNRKQIAIERPVGYQSVNYVQGEYTLDFILNSLDEAGIDRAIMKVPCCHEWLSLDMCRLFNDGMADFARKSNGRLIALAVIPPWGTEGDLEELERCRNELGMTSIQLCAHYGNLYLDDAAFAAMFKRLNDYGMTAYVHHTPVPVEHDFIYDYNNLRRSYGRCVDQTIAVSRELLSGMFEQYPEVKVVHSMLGGGIFTYLNMLVPPKTQETDNARRFEAEDDKFHLWLKENIYFEMSHAQPWGSMLESAIKVLGSDHIIYGSSFPVRREWFMEGVNYINSLRLEEKDKQLILYENAKRLYKIQ